MIEIGIDPIAIIVLTITITLLIRHSLHHYHYSAYSPDALGEKRERIG